MFFDAALVYDPATRRCDLALGEDGDLVVDDTPITSMLLSIGLDRRAAEDDPLPQGRTEFLTDYFSERRGWAGDAFDPAGERIGSRVWLLDRAKQTETTRLLMAMWLDEAMSWAEPETGRAAEIDVQWVRPETLGYRVMVADTSISIAGVR